MTMLPNYLIAVVCCVFLVYCFLHLKVHRGTVSNGCIFGLGILIALLLLGMSIYGIIFHVPLSQVQSMIEQSLN